MSKIYIASFSQSGDSIETVKSLMSFDDGNTLFSEFLADLESIFGADKLLLGTTGNAANQKRQIYLKTGEFAGAGSDFGHVTRIGFLGNETTTTNDPNYAIFYYEAIKDYYADFLTFAIANWTSGISIVSKTVNDSWIDVTNWDFINPIT